MALVNPNAQPANTRRNPAPGIIGVVKQQPKEPKEKKFLDMLAEYERRDKEIHGRLLEDYQQGENASYANLFRQTDENQGTIDQNLMGRGLYNTTVRDVMKNRNLESEDAGRLEIAGRRASLLNSLRPDPTVYGPLIASIGSSKQLSGTGFKGPNAPQSQSDPSQAPASSVGDEFDRMDKAAVDEMLSTYQGGAETAYGRLRSSVRGEQSGISGALRARGLSGATEAITRRSQERGAVGEAKLADASASALNASRPNPGLYGPLIQQAAESTISRGNIGHAILPVAGAVLGGVVGGPVGAAVGGGLGGALGQYGAAGAAQGAMSGFGYGSAIRGFGGNVGTTGGSTAMGGGGGSFGTMFNGSSGGFAERGGYGSYGDYPTPSYRGTIGAVEIPGDYGSALGRGAYT